MKKILLSLVILLGIVTVSFPLGPVYYGARSLSLGYAGTGYNFDVNAIFINPALLSSLNYSMTGYQYQHSYMDYKNFVQDLQGILEYNLKNFEALSAVEKENLFTKLNDLFQARSGIWGFRANVPGFVTKDYGISFSTFKTTIVNPSESSIFDKSPEEVSNSDIATLTMNFLSLDYKKISFSYSLAIGGGTQVGISLHYLYGRAAQFDAFLVDGDIFTEDYEPRDYLEYGWDQANDGDKFSRITADLGISANFGRYFNVGLRVKNIGKAKIKTTDGEIKLNNRITAGLAFTPNPQWSIFLDMDITETDLLYSGEKMQPISLGVEKGFFKNKFFLRAGFLTDLTDKYFIGKKANVLYGFGFGFHVGKLVVDMAVGLDGSGTLNNLAVSGFFIFK